MNDDNLLGGVLGQLGQTVKQAVKQVVKIPEEMAKDVGGQVGSAKPGAVQNLAKQNTNENKVLDNKPQWTSDEERIKFLQDLYGSSEKTSQNQTKSEGLKNEKPTEFEERIRDKTPEEQKKLMELRNQLHKENYYDPIFNPKNPPAGGEERPAEKIEKEKKMEALEFEKKEKNKPPPLAVVRERNKAEMFRGAAG